MKYDLFLGGPWERFAPFPYKTEIKNAFLGKNLFDPESQDSQKTGEWFEDNYNALENSLAMVALVPSFPFPGVGPEAGIFYSKRRGSAKLLAKPLDELTIIWPKELKPDYGKRVAEKMGYVVTNSEEAIARLKIVLK